ncbi:hypothetical protein [Marinobacter apostichopi]|uniref:hypothetical protein n=1 Tax=Marinobacter apostichopi TaxID=3035454 RepID=UPI002572DD31|nr:hypothetical protein [Marinobacter sp. LA51]
MNDQQIYTAHLAEGSTVPTLLCGHCRSILSRARIFRNQGDKQHDAECQTIGLCSADDCGAVNCCDAAMAHIDNPELLLGIAS